MGSKRFWAKTLETLNLNPMVMGGVTLKHAEKEKYLGDWVHELGCKESVSATIKERVQKQMGKCDEKI